MSNTFSEDQATATNWSVLVKNRDHSKGQQSLLYSYIKDISNKAAWLWSWNNCLYKDYGAPTVVIQIIYPDLLSVATQLEQHATSHYDYIVGSTVKDSNTCTGHFLAHCSAAATLCEHLCSKRHSVTRVHGSMRL